MKGKVALALAVLVARASYGPAGQPRPALAELAAAIRAEATRANDDPAGLPLPLVGHWHTGQRPGGFKPEHQIALIEKGHHLLPWFQLNMRDGAYYEKAIKAAARLKLPISFISTQWERVLSDDKAYFGLPGGENPNVVAPDGKVLNMVSPFGPVEPWRRVGRKWTDTPMLRKLQQWYPDPPRVLFVSNNEHRRLRWHQAGKSKRYLDRHGEGKPGDYKRKVFAEGWIERYRALQEGMREGLLSPAWRKNAKFIGYEAFGPAHFGRWGGWMEYSLYTRGRIDPNPLAWDGGSPSYYVHNWNPSTDYTVWSPQIESMNWPFMLAEARRLNPDFWWEVSVWDGHQPGKDSDMRKVYARRGQTFTPRRYAGCVQFGMWLLRPRVVREFRGWVHPAEEMKPWLTAIVASVDRVHRSGTLVRFWRKGRLVANPAGKHPYQRKIPAEYKDAERWFLLDTSLTPNRPWKLSTELPVFAVALADGRKPRRRWLVYAHAPVKPRKDVRITVPGHGAVTVDVAVGGSFHVMDEKAGTVTQP